jgi:corrinoid protein of di/trimethylamine methyltransferase
MTDLAPLKNAVIDGDAKLTRQLTEQLLAAGADPQSLLSDALVPAMAVVGDRFECGEYFVPELLIAARAMKSALEPLRPLLAKAGAKSAGTVVIGTVKGDLHDIGKNLVAAMLEGGGFEVVDLGVDVAPEKFVAVLNEKKPDLVALSALLTTTMTAMKDTIKALEAAGVRKTVKIMVGGAPVTDAFAKEIGADGYSDNAGAAVHLARKLLGSAA